MGGGERAFYTFRGYTLHSAQRPNSLSASMEDYLEMIYRLSQQDSYTRVLELAAALHVQPPSASRMVRRLAAEGLVKYERYGIITLTEQGRTIGHFLLQRHNLLERFMSFLGLGDVLEDAERIEHNISNQAVAGIAKLLDFFSADPGLLAEWQAFLETCRTS
jgi:Mn-dependent DtxR family transcriptional regulator